MSRVIVPLEQTADLENPESHVLLPIISLSEKTDEALSIMRAANRAALIATAQDTIVLLTAADVVVGRSSGAQSIADVNPTAVFHALPDAKMQFHEIVKDPGQQTSRLAFIFQFQGKNQARLVTGNSQLNFKYGGSLRDIYCDGPGQHDNFPPPPPSPGDRCPYGDGFIVAT